MQTYNYNLPNGWKIEMDVYTVRVPMPPRSQLTITVFRKNGILISRTILPYEGEED